MSPVLATAAPDMEGPPQCCDVPLVGMAVSEVGSTRWIDVNQTLCELLGYDRAALLARGWSDLTHPEDWESSRSQMERAQAGATEQYRIRKRYLRRDGGVVYAMVDVRPIARAGVVRWLLASIVDISDQVQAQEEARDASLLLERFSENMPGIFYEFLRRPDGSSCLPYASNGMHELFGFAPGDLLHDASPFFARIHPDDFPHVVSTIRESADQLTPWLCEFRYRSPHNSERWFRGESRPRREAGGATRWFGFMSDATHWYQQQEALAQSEQQLRFLFEHAAEGILLYDADRTHFVDVNPRAEAILGYERDALIGRSPLDVSAPVQPNGLLCDAYLWQALRMVETTGGFVGEWTGLHHDGHRVPCELRISLLPVAGRRLFRSTIVDISDRLRAQATLAQLQQAIESAVNGVALADPQGALTFVNSAFLSMWGYEQASDVLGRSALTFWRTPDEAQAVMEAIATKGNWHGELTALRHDGTTRIMELNASAVRDARNAVAGMLASFSDITETKRLEQELHQSQKLESIGRLAGGVAHDFNNLLTVIKASLDLAFGELPVDSAARVDLREVSRAADSAARLTQQLLAFSRKQAIAPTTLNLNDVVQRVSGMMQRLLGEDILLRTVTAYDLGFVHFDAGQAEQVLVNLAVNARDAMPHGGALTIETCNVRLGDDFARLHAGVQPADCVLLTVTDTGEGMTEDVLAHAFEPFFTTKAPGKGTGLGLAVIHGAVTQNGGRIDVQSTVGHGTTFRIYLPRVAAPAVPDELEHVAPMPRGTELILLVEDDLAVRQLMMRLLAPLGYRVVAFGDGAQAIQWLETTSDSFALLLTDVIMPGMNGRQLADAVLARRPGTHVLFASGYTANVIESHGVLDESVPFLPKPFSVRDLAVAVRAAIDAR
jgi:PAS domain S-box-containing protein